MFALLSSVFLVCHSAFAEVGDLRKGSFSFVVSQRFFDDEKLSRVNGFSHWGAIQFDATVGLYEFPYRLEPYLGVSYIRNSSILCGLDDNNDCVYENGRLAASQDRLNYSIYGGHFGLRHKFWNRDFSIFIPWMQVGGVYRYARVRKLTLNQEQKLNTGGDFGAEVAGGFLVSFFYDEAIASDMDSTWDMQDFALMTHFRYSPAGWGRHGLGLLESTGGWDLGLGLFMDW